MLKHDQKNRNLALLDIDTLISLINSNKVTDNEILSMSFKDVKKSNSDIDTFLNNERIIKILIKNPDFMLQISEYKDIEQIITIPGNQYHLIRSKPDDMDINTFLINVQKIFYENINTDHDNVNVFSSLMRNNDFLEYLIENINNVKDDHVKENYLLHLPRYGLHRIHKIFTDYILKHKNILRSKMIKFNLPLIIRYAINEDDNKKRLLLNLINESIDDECAKYVSIELAICDDVKEELKEFEFNKDGKLKGLIE